MTTNSNQLITPWGRLLVNLLAEESEREALQARAASLPRFQLTPRNLCDVELMATGGFSPLDRFMGRSDYERVLEEMRLGDGTLFPLPVTLTCKRDQSLKLDEEITLVDQFNNLLAVMRVEEIFAWDKRREALLAYGSEDLRHPLVAEMNSWGELCVSGPLRVLQLPPHYDFKALRLSPREVREQLAAKGHANIVAFQTQGFEIVVRRQL